MDGREQETAGDADRFGDIIIFPMFAAGAEVVAFFKNDDQPRRDFQKRLVLVRAERGKVAQPVLGHAAVVIFVFFFFGSEADLALDFWVADGTKNPRLFVRAGRGRRGCHDDLFDDGGVDGLVAEMAERAAQIHIFIKSGRGFERPN